MVKITGGRVMVQLHEISRCKRKQERGWSRCSLVCGEPKNDSVAWPFTCSFWRGLGLMLLWMLLTMSVGPNKYELPTYKMAWHPPEQAITFLFMEMLKDGGTKWALGSLSDPRITIPSLTLSWRALQLLPWLCFSFLWSHHLFNFLSVLTGTRLRAWACAGELPRTSSPLFSKFLFIFQVNYHYVRKVFLSRVDKAPVVLRLCRLLLMSSMYQGGNSLCVNFISCCFTYVYLTRCEGKLDPQCLQVPSTQAMYNVWLLNEWMGGSGGDTGCLGRVCLPALPPHLTQTLRSLPGEHEQTQGPPKSRWALAWGYHRESHQFSPLVLRPCLDPSFLIQAQPLPHCVPGLGGK